MGAFATVTLPLGGRTGAAAIALEVVDTYPGTRGAAVSSGGDSVSFDLHFPGNLSGLVARLAANGFASGRAAISIPAVSLAPERHADPSETAAVLNHGPHVWDPEFTKADRVADARLLDGRVEASIEPSTDALHQLYDSMLHLGLTAKGAAPSGVA